MKDFLSEQWFEELNARLSPSTSHGLPEGSRACRIVFDVVETPAHLPRTITLSISGDGARVDPGTSPDADATIRIAFEDADALTSGRLDSATALREGRIKIRGDVNVLVPLASWLHAAFLE